MMDPRFPLLPYICALSLPAVWAVSAEARPLGNEFGTAMAQASEIDIGTAMDVLVSGSHLYAIGAGSLHIFEISEPRNPKPVSKLGGLGKVRQIEAQNGIAAITSREDGTFFVDIRRPDAPELLCHYDSIELATGIALSGNLAFIACRQAGVELLDIGDPRNPVHLSTVHTGEAQGVVARNGYLYAGVWASSELVIADIRDPHRPAIVARAELDGYGDGVDVRGRFCYVATGHHSRARPKTTPGDPGYGHGHGLEIFDISDPASPRFVSRIKTPDFYAIHNDTWNVTVSDTSAFLADTHNGVFVVDIRDPRSPRFTAHHQLAIDEEHGIRNPVNGFAVGDGVIYAAGAWSNLHVLNAPGIAETIEPEPDNAPRIGPRPEPETEPRVRVYRPEGQVHGVAMAGETAMVASGMAGLQAVQLEPDIKPLREYRTQGFAMDVAVHGDRVFVGEGRGGLSIWKHTGSGDLTLLGRYEVPGQTIKQIEIPPPGKYALVQVSAAHLHIVDVTDPARPTRVLEERNPGLLYYHPLAEGLREGRYASCFWHVSGFKWYDLGHPEGPQPSGETYPFRTGSRNGMAHLEDGRVLVTYQNGYLLLEPNESRPPEELKKYTVPGAFLGGKPTIHAKTLFSANRYGGTVTAIDIENPEEPGLIDELNLKEHPSPVVAHGDIILVPGGYDGLILWDRIGDAP
jgi:hypothetical protein